MSLKDLATVNGWSHVVRESRNGFTHTLYAYGHKVFMDVFERDGVVTKVRVEDYREGFGSPLLFGEGFEFAANTLTEV